MKTALKASVLGVGSELTAGQIVNANAAWISRQLKEMGFLTSVHLVVPDDKDLILKGLNFCSAESDLIFVTGGLGPTTDDFTREIIAQWSQTELEFDPATWNYITERLSARGVAIEEFQKQQCYFPKGSKILSNSRGTAHGFYFNISNKAVFVLPGPPREIEVIWQDHVQLWLRNLTKDHDAHLTLSWDVLGKSEGEVAKLTESTLAGSGLEIGYRVHMPYVEVKASFLKSQRHQKEKYFQALDSAFSPWIVLRKNQDAAEIFSQKIVEDNPVRIVDEASNGYLLQRLQAPFKRLKYWENKKLIFCNDENDQTSVEQQTVFKLLKADNWGAQISWHCKGKSHTEILTNPYSHFSMEERRQQYFAERAFLFWSQKIP